MNGKHDVSIFVATHKKIELLLPPCYRLIEVNADKQKELWEGYYYDNTGENISSRNYCYSELSALYWIWKNDDSKIVGLCHYRRLFSKETMDTLVPQIKTYKTDLRNICVDSNWVMKILDSVYDCILIKPYTPYPETVREEMIKYVYDKDLKILEETVRQYYPEYYESLNSVLNSKNHSFFNMIIARKEFVDRYCEWLFDILFQLEQKCDISNYDAQHKRIFGYFAEILLGVYIIADKSRPYYVKSILIKKPRNILEKIKIYLYGIRNRYHNYLFSHNHYQLIMKYYKVFHSQIVNRLENYLQYKVDG